MELRKCKSTVSNKLLMKFEFFLEFSTMSEVVSTSPIFEAETFKNN